MAYVVNELYRFRMLMAGVYVGIAVSSTYGFSIFTEHLKVKYNFDQSDITTISTVGNCVGYLSFFAGALYDYAGPKVLLPIAGVLGFLGFLLFGLAFDDVIPRREGLGMVVQLSIFNSILYLGCPALDVGTLMPLMLNFPVDRGYIIMIQKTFSGLGTSVLMAYFNGWFRAVGEPSELNNYSGYAYFVGAQILVCALIGAYFIDQPPYFPCQYTKKRLGDAELVRRQGMARIFSAQPAPRRRLYIGCALVGVNLVFLTISAVVPAYVPAVKRDFIALSVVTVVLVASFAVLPLPLQCLGRYAVVRRTTEFPSIGVVDAPVEADVAEAEADVRDARSSQENAPSLTPGAEDLKLVPEACNEDALGKGTAGRPPLLDEEQKKEAAEAVTSTVGEPQYHGSFWRHLLSIDLWLLWLSFFGMWGTGTVMQMNAAQIYRSRNNGVYDSARLTLYVTMIGVGSAVGRFISGFFDMQLVARQRAGSTTMLTTVALPAGAVLLCVAYLLFAVLPVDGLLLPFLLGSIGTGLGWGLGSLSIRIIYADDIGKHYNFMFSSGFISTIALNRFMFGSMFDAEARRLGTQPYCNRSSCVRNQMFVLMAVNGVACLAAIAVHLRFARYVARKKRERQGTVLLSATEHEAANEMAVADPRGQRYLALDDSDAADADARTSA